MDLRCDRYDRHMCAAAADRAAVSSCSAVLSKGSRRVHAWFVSTKLYQDNLKSYAEGEGMNRKTKARIMRTLTVQMAIGYVFMGHVPFGRVFMVCVWAGLMVYFSFGVKTQSE